MTASSFSLGKWVARGVAGASACVTLVSAPPRLRAATAEPRPAEPHTGSALEPEPDTARIVAQQYLRQIQELRRSQLSGRLDGAGERLLAALEKAREAALAPDIEANYGARLREHEVMNARLDEIEAALAG